MQIQKSYKDNDQAFGNLYLVPTPIGNLEDMTFRAIQTLKEVDIILAEDTRRTIKLLNHFEITTPLVSFHEHNQVAKLEFFMERLYQGEDLAMVSDAGMPLINDPGHPLVQACLEANINVLALPGANAALTALVASGLSTLQFTYYGFFPRETKQQKAMVDLLNTRTETAIFYESPFRIKKTINFLAQTLGDQRQLVIARELSKRHEEFIRGRASEIAQLLDQEPIKGEMVLLIEGGRQAMNDNPSSLTLPLKEQVTRLMATNNLSQKEAIKQVAKNNHLKKQDVYKLFYDE